MSGQLQQPSRELWANDDENDYPDDDEYCDCDRDDDLLRDRCVLGAACCVADPYHSSDECFDAEWAEAYFAEAAESETADDTRMN